MDIRKRVLFRLLALTAVVLGNTHAAEILTNSLTMVQRRASDEGNHVDNSTGSLNDEAKKAKTINTRGAQASGQSCYSSVSNEVIPIAHVRGSTGYTVSSAGYMNDQTYYSMGWECSSSDGVAFVDGGMNFSASDQSLRVPQSGYYLVSSQVYFQVERTMVQNRAVYHQVLINTNCDANSANKVYSQSYASPAEGSVELPTVTTHSSLVVRLCAGGRVKVVVPRPPLGTLEGAPCCPYSLPFATFFDVYMTTSIN